MALAPQENVFIKLYRALRPTSVHFLDLIEQDKVRRIVQRLINGNDQAVEEAREYLLSLQKKYYSSLASYYAARNGSITFEDLPNICFPISCAAGLVILARSSSDPSEITNAILSLLLNAFVTLYALNKLVQLSKNAIDIVRNSPLEFVPNIFLPLAVVIAGTLATRASADLGNSTEGLIFELVAITLLTVYALYQFCTFAKYLIHLSHNSHEILKDLVSFATAIKDDCVRQIRNFSGISFFAAAPPQPSRIGLDVTPLIVNNIQQLNAGELLDLYKAIFPANILRLENVPQLTR